MQDKPNDLMLPEKVLLRFQKRGESMLGYMIAYDPDDPTFKDKSNTVLEWSSGKTLRAANLVERQALVMPNESAEGFRLQHMVERYSTDNKVWRVLDPRGFELEIMTENLDYLLDHCDVKDRVLQGELIWMLRMTGGTNWLVPADTPDLEAIQEKTKLRQKARTSETLSLRDINRGDLVRLYDGRVVRYFGSMWSEYVSRSWTRHGVKQWDRMPERHQWFEVLEGDTYLDRYDGKETEGLDSMTSLRVIEVVEAAQTPWTIDEVEDAANKLLAAREKGSWSYRTFLRCKKFALEDLKATMLDNHLAWEIDGKVYKRHGDKL